MELVILGSGTLEFLPDRGCAAHLLRGLDEGPVLLDSGPGCLDRLARLGVDPLGLCAILHSHLHLDHLADLFPLLFHRRCSPHQKSLTLGGASGHEERVRKVARALDPKLMGTDLHFWETESDGILRKLPGSSLQVAAFPALHSQSPRVLRIEGMSPEPWSFAYSGDSGPCQGLVDAARSVDWLVVECTTPNEERREKHLVPSDVAQVIAEARPRGTALVHLSPLWESPEQAAQAVRDELGDVSAVVVGAHDGLVLPLPWALPGPSQDG